MTSHPPNPTPWQPRSRGSISFLASILLLLSLLPLAQARDSSTNSPPHFLIVVGAPGEPLYLTNFTQQAQAWSQLATRAAATSSVIGLDPAQTNDLDQFRTSLQSIPVAASEPLFLIFLGHGTYDGREARFNLRGPDLSASELQSLLDPFQRTVALLNTTSASAPFLNKLSRSNRIVITATRSGNEVNATHLGESFASAISDPATDLDQDGETSLLELFLAAATRTAEFYKSEGRLATEHPLIDDNGDARGTPAEWFQGTRATRKPTGGARPDGFRAHQIAVIPAPEEFRLPPELRARRDQLEQAIARLREDRPPTPTDAYYLELETLLLEIARLHFPTNR